MCSEIGRIELSGLRAKRYQEKVRTFKNCPNAPTSEYEESASSSPEFSRRNNNERVESSEIGSTMEGDNSSATASAIPSETTRAPTRQPSAPFREPTQSEYVPGGAFGSILT